MHSSNDSSTTHPILSIYARGFMLSLTLFISTYPVDFSRTWLQQKNTDPKNLWLFLQTHGARSLFYGSTPTFLRTVLKETGYRNLIRDMGGSYFRHVFPDSIILPPLATGLLLAIADTVILNPVELAKNLAIANPGIFARYPAETYPLYAKRCVENMGGLQQCFQGAQITFLRNTANQLSLLLVSQTMREVYLKKKFQKQATQQKLTLTEISAIGIVTGVVGWAATTPFDALKAKAQATLKGSPLLHGQRLSSFYFRHGGWYSLAYYTLYAVLTNIAMEAGHFPSTKPPLSTKHASLFSSQAALALPSPASNENILKTKKSPTDRNT
ncbi:MAG: hypothetical protein A3F10_01165 [Coxiella sp. RIFCSPHIGHO2_12_FULL_42_15]|nr:MAG: hypothetical protein A3F10_01165 [Coxiella sp. RIFCSPHIGHO2_12_FULL_42_15]